MTDEEQTKSPDGVAAKEGPELPKAAKSPEPEPDEPEAKAKPAPKAKKKPQAHELAELLGNDPILLLDALVHVAGHETMRRCPALANICQQYRINEADMKSWIERNDYREQMRLDRQRKARANAKARKREAAAA